MDNAQIEAIRLRYTIERPRYSELAAEVKLRLSIRAHESRIECDCSGRAKDVPNLLRKALLKTYHDPYEQIRDKAGARIVVSFPDDLPRALDLVEQLFAIDHREDKTEALAPNQLGYRGVHFEVRLLDSAVNTAATSCHDLQGLVCEVQVQTRAQNLWNDISHALLYKPAQDLPSSIKRRIFRLVALMEIFDDELAMTQREIDKQPGSQEAAMLAQLERHFLSLVGRASYNRELSFEILEVLCDLLSDDEAAQFPQLIDRFIQRRKAQLTQAYGDYFDVADANPLLYQPETILLLERLEHDRFKLRDRWIQAYPHELLEQLGSIWGVPVPG